MKDVKSITYLKFHLKSIESIINQVENKKNEGENDLAKQEEKKRNINYCIRYERGVFPIDLLDIKRIIKEYSVQLYAHKYDNLDEMDQFNSNAYRDDTLDEIDQFFDRQQLVRPTHGEIDNLKRSIICQRNSINN